MSDSPMYSADAEMSVLGSMILSERAAAEVAGLLVEDDFYRPAHRLVYRAIRGLMKANKAIDLVTLGEALRASGDLASVGGQNYLNDLDLHVPSAANVASYAGIVLRWAKLRDASEAARGILRTANGADEGAVDAILTETKALRERLTYGAAHNVQGDTLAAIERVLGRKNGGGMATGFPSIDNRICRQHRGMARGAFTLFQALPGRGKSSTMFSVAFPALDRGEAGVVASFADLTEDDVVYRAIRYCSGFAGTLEECYDDDERRRVRDAADRVHGWKMTFYAGDSAPGASAIESFRPWLLRHCDKEGAPGFVSMDYAQRITTTDRRLNAEATPRNQYVAEQVRLLVGEVPEAAFMIGSQVTPKGKDGKGEMEYQSQHASDWDQHAALRLLMLEDGTRMHVPKNRFGTWNQTLDMVWLGGPQVVRESGS